jgi:uncharacterized protein YecE (DUF72 family)
MAGRILIGTSGFSYPHWRGVLYPEGLAQRSWLERYCEVFNTLEINATFYRLPKESTVKGWYDRTPEEFIFALKASRIITHVKKLIGSADLQENFASSISPLQEKLGPILFQLPPGMKADTVRLKDFFVLLRPGCRYAFEFRHSTWFCDEVFEILRMHDAALVLHDYRRFDCPMILSAGWSYIRLHGPTGTYTGEYGKDGLRQWAEILVQWAAEGIDAYVYFNNDSEGDAVRDALTLASMIRR